MLLYQSGYAFPLCHHLYLEKMAACLKKQTHGPELNKTPASVF